MTSPLRRLAAALLLPAAATLADAPDPRHAPPFAEAIEVRELEVHFDDSVLPPLESMGRRADGDFLVLVDGRPLEASAASDVAVRAERLGDAMVWLDPDLASPATLAAAARALLEPPAALANADRLRLVVADAAEGREPLDVTGAPRALAERLAASARRWDASSAAAPTTDRRLRALDRLAAAIAPRDRSGPRALVVAADGWSVDGEWLDDLSDVERGAAPRRAATGRLEQVARACAAAGWTTLAFAAPVRETETWARGSNHESVAVGGNLSHRFPMWTLPLHRSRPAAAESRRLDVATDFGLRPWAHVVRAGAGTLAGDAPGLSRALVRLAERRRLLRRLPERPPGPLSPLEVRWTGGDGRTLPAPRWLAHGSPPELTSIRLRALAAGDLAAEPSTARASGLGRGGAPVVCWPSPGAAAAPPGTPGAPATRRWLRASAIARAEPGGGGAIASGTPGAAVEAASGEPCAPLPPSAPASDATIVLLEDLESGAWRAEILHTAR